MMTHEIDKEKLADMVVADLRLDLSKMQEMVGLIRTMHEFHNKEHDCGSLGKVQEQMTEMIATWRAKQAEKRTQNLDLEECIEEIEEQMRSIKLQKDTLEKPDADEAFLKNELSLFLNVSSILPDLGDPKFSGTFVDKHRGVKTFKFLSTEMSQFETCNHAWDMMR